MNFDHPGETVTPLERVLELYRVHRSRRTLAEDVAAHLRHGVVLSTGRFLVLARPVPRTAEAGAINDPEVPFAGEECDTWYVYAFAGDIREALGHFPYPLPYLGFERAGRNGLRFHPLPRFLARCGALLPERE